MRVIMLCRLFLWHSIIFLVGCSGTVDDKFRLIPSDESGVTFRNTLSETADFNILNYLYFYNGGGVSIGDVNNDGFADIYFTANQLPNKLYINTGNLTFRDVTQEAGVAGFDGWATGVTMADVNNDGRLDIYVSYLGDFLIYNGRNQLFINEGNNGEGIPRFAERALDFGLDLVGFSTQSAFFDYDRDGDLDMFMLTHSTHNNGTYGRSSLRYTSHRLAGDRLLRNDNGRFVDVTRSAGIYNSALGYGLGVAISDVNLDGWPDIYVGNDFHENDYLYINSGNGTFKEALEEQMPHTSRYTMGIDFADFNNDAFPDLMALDMLSEDPQVLKSAAAEDPFDVYKFKIGFGYHHQFARNSLQLNNQNGTFSEIALLAGVSATDWSWSALFGDYDLDGRKDIFVSNGIRRRLNDLDYINFMQTDSMQARMNSSLSERELIYIEKMPRVKIQNYLFVNNNDSTFTNKAPDIGMNHVSYSNGAAYGDLDNDGDLDLVINNIDDEAFIYENLTRQKSETAEASHFLQFSFHGGSGNRLGIGTTVLVYDSGQLQMQECMPTRGFQSSVEHKLTFGLGNRQRADSVLIIWNDGAYQILRDVKADRHWVVNRGDANDFFDYNVFHTADPIFKMASPEISIPFIHKENDFVEFNREQLIPHMMSAEGPASAVGDINGDGRDDLFIGGGKWQPAALFVQTQQGKFARVEQAILAADSVYEDVDAVFFDADNDNDEDLFVVSGGNEFSGKSPYRKPRLYLNEGKGGFKRSTGVPDVFLVGACVATDDVDSDGDVDLFLGARTTTWRYGIKPDSYLLLNDGAGNFTNETRRIAPDLSAFGFVKSATWADIDNDKDNDLVVAAEWSPISIFLNDGGKFSPMKLEGSGLEQSNGWWNAISAYDFDGDGDVDLLAGNLGLNSKLQASVDKPVKMFVGDFDSNDSTDQILTHYMAGKEYPFHTRDEMVKQMPFLKKRFLSYQVFANTDIHEMFEEAQLEAADHFVVHTFETSMIENLGMRKFRVTALPKAAQFSPVNAILIDDFNNDGNADVILGGNFYPVTIQRGRYDASYGLVLKGNGKGEFTPVSAMDSGLSIRAETRGLRSFIVRGKKFFIAVRNDKAPLIFTSARGSYDSLTLLTSNFDGG